MRKKVEIIEHARDTVRTVLYGLKQRPTPYLRIPKLFFKELELKEKDIMICTLATIIYENGREEKVLIYKKLS